MQTTTELGQVNGRMEFDSIRVNAANLLNVRISGMPQKQIDCDFVYLISTDTKLTKARAIEVKFWVAGFIASLRSWR
jgi:hypothetical protein